MSENRKAEVGEPPSASMCFALFLTMSSLSWHSGLDTSLSSSAQSHQKKGPVFACLIVVSGKFSVEDLRKITFAGKGRVQRVEADVDLFHLFLCRDLA